MFAKTRPLAHGGMDALLIVGGPETSVAGKAAEWNLSG
jgi:hypothetical protein